MAIEALLKGLVMARVNQSGVDIRKKQIEHLLAKKLRVDSQKKAKRYGNHQS